MAFEFGQAITVRSSLIKFRHGVLTISADNLRIEGDETYIKMTPGRCQPIAAMLTCMCDSDTASRDHFKANGKGTKFVKWLRSERDNVLRSKFQTKGVRGGVTPRGKKGRETMLRMSTYELISISSVGDVLGMPLKLNVPENRKNRHSPLYVLADPIQWEWLAKAFKAYIEIDDSNVDMGVDEEVSEDGYSPNEAVENDVQSDEITEPVQDDIPDEHGSDTVMPQQRQMNPIMNALMRGAVRT